MGKIIGIDLGTTNSCVAVMEAGKPKVIHSAEGENTIPSVVDPVKNIVGRIARRQQVVNPKNTIYSIKRLMGRRFSDPSVQVDMKWLPYEIKSGPNDMAVVEIEGKKYTPQEISAKILQKCKSDAEAYLGETVTEAVITVPAYFDDSQRQATKLAGEIAGLKVERIVNEPTAASLAYGLDKMKQETIVVYDLGGGTFDVSVLEVGDGVIQVKATSGDTHLGGDDFDQKIINFLLSEFKKENGIDLSHDRQALQRLRDAAEKAKIELSSSPETEVNVPYITADSTGPKHLVLKMTRSKLEQLVDELIERTFVSTKQAISDAKLDVSKINEVVLVGGMTRMPKVQERVKSFFGKEPHKGVNPDEVVAIGAAIQGGVLTQEVKEVLLLDVTPLTLGLETLGGVRTPIIERNTTIPTKKTQVFSTAADSQTSVEIHVLQGEREMAVDNISLGRFILDGIPPAPRGVPQVEVTFDIDSNGIINVTAKDKATNKEQKITIQKPTGISKEDAQRMADEAKVHADEDRKRKEEVEVRNQADTICYTAEKTLREAGDKVDNALKSEVEEKTKSLRGVISSASIEELKQKTQELSLLLQKIGQAMYGSTPTGQPSPSGSEPGGPSAGPSSSGEGKSPEGEVKEGEVIS